MAVHAARFGAEQAGDVAIARWQALDHLPVDDCSPWYTESIAVMGVLLISSTSRSVAGRLDTLSVDAQVEGGCSATLAECVVCQHNQTRLIAPQLCDYVIHRLVDRHQLPASPGCDLFGGQLSEAGALLRRVEAKLITVVQYVIGPIVEAFRWCRARVSRRTHERSEDGRILERLLNTALRGVIEGF